jgi:hypothetical protein
MIFKKIITHKGEEITLEFNIEIHPHSIFIETKNLLEDVDKNTYTFYPFNKEERQQLINEINRLK